MDSGAASASAASGVGRSSAGGVTERTAELHSALEAVARALIREELLRSGCERTLEAFDAASPAAESELDLLSLQSSVVNADPEVAAAGSSTRTAKMVDYIRAASKRAARRREGPASLRAATPGGSADGPDADGWTRAEVRALRTAMKAHPSSLDRKERFRLIANDVGRSKRECYDKAKALKAAAAARRSEGTGHAAAKSSGGKSSGRHGKGHARSKISAEAAADLAAAKARRQARSAAKSSGTADALSSLLGDEPAGPRGRKEVEDDGWGDMMSHVKEVVAHDPRAVARERSRAARTAAGAGGAGVGAGAGAGAGPSKRGAARRAGGWASGSPSAAAEGARGSAKAAAGRAGPGWGSRGPRRGRHGELVIEDDEAEDEADAAGAHGSRGAARRSPDTDPAPGWGARRARGDADAAAAAPGWGSRGPAGADRARDNSLLASVAKRDDSGALVLEDADDFGSELDGAVVARPAPSIQSKAIVAPSEFGLSGKAMTAEECAGLRRLLFGDSLRAFNDAWKKQGFFFSAIPKLGYGIVQTEGGPCGPLASVNAYVIRNLLFVDGDASSEGWEDPAEEKQCQAVAEALSEILWQARARGGKAIVCMPGRRASVGKSGLYRPDGFTEKMVKFAIGSRDTLENVINGLLPMFMKPDGLGVVSFVYSVMLSRTIRGIESDMDDILGEGAKLIGAHNYATQEMVNLILCGRAHSNVFNEEKVMESGDDRVVLRGPPRQSSIGFVTLFEHYGYVAVGSHYHEPKVPIWVVCSESHYSVLFAKETRLARGPQSRPFDLFYYDPLARQDEVLRLTVDPSPSPPLTKEQANADDNPPLDLCIRTRWSGASVDWNGSEALL